MARELLCWKRARAGPFRPVRTKHRQRLPWKSRGWEGREELLQPRGSQVLQKGRRKWRRARIRLSPRGRPNATARRTGRSLGDCVEWLGEKSLFYDEVNLSISFFFHWILRLGTPWMIFHCRRSNFNKMFYTFLSKLTSIRLFAFFRPNTQTKP